MALITWMKENNMWESRKTGTRTPTHVFLNGGVAYIPWTKTEVFFEKYIQDLCLNKHLYIVEKYQKVFKMFADLDFKTQYNIDLNYTIDMILKSLPDHLGREKIYICKNNNTNGIHLVWENITTSSEKAMKDVREWINNLPENIDNPIDTSVYKNGGLRMIGSLKKTQKTIYLPYGIYKNKLLQKTCQKITLQELRNFSIRIQEDNNATNETYNSDNVIPKIPVIKRFYFEIIKYTNELNLRGMKIYDNKIIIPSYSKQCDIAKRQHSSNHIYFIINKRPFKIIQKCHSEKCRDKEHLLYIHKNIPITIKEVARMYNFGMT